MFNVWNNVHSLNFTSTSFNLQWPNVVNLLSVEDTAWYAQKLGALNQRISAQAPNVFSLETHLFNTTEESKYPFTALISAYSTQLKRLSCNLPAKLLFPQFSDNLHTLEFAVDERTIAGFPDINTDCLDKLSLKRLPSTFSWNWFKPGNCTDCIRFSKLSSLNLEISGSDKGISTTPDEPKLEVSMPMLRSAVINIGRHGSANWNAIVRMNNLSSFSFKGAFSGIAAVCRGVEFNHVSSYTMTVVSIEKNNEDAFYETTNRVFSGFDIRNHAGLHLPVLPFDINVDAINWTLLTTLNCRRVQFEKMIQLLPKLANLKRLEYVFVPDYLPDVASIANRDSAQDNTDNYNDSVLSTSVLSLYLSISRVHVNQGSLVDEEEERAVACCTYLLLLLPHLLSVFINNPINWDTEDIIEGFEDKFPHLSRLRE
ncbi:hypothetical protein H4R99_005069 [Coemansia sp. RSA 1722]|nr:hypothetical protein H4R99_005069 [Coemansia sp. RSA 1722]